MNVTSKLKDRLPHVTDPFALAGTRAITKGSGDLSKITDLLLFLRSLGKENWQNLAKLAKIFREGVCHTDTTNVSVQINWYFVTSTFYSLSVREV